MHITILPIKSLKSFLPCFCQFGKGIVLSSRKVVRLSKPPIGLNFRVDIDTKGCWHLLFLQKHIRHNHPQKRLTIFYELNQQREVAVLEVTITDDDRSTLQLYENEIAIHEKMTESCFTQLYYTSRKMKKDGSIQIKMGREYCNLSNLYSFRNHSFFSQYISEVMHIVKDLTSALVLMKKKQVLHCDLKLDNILITRKGDRVYGKINDFSISQTTEKGFLNNNFLAGILQFFSPEQCLAGSMQYDGSAALQWVNKLKHKYEKFKSKGFKLENSAEKFQNARNTGQSLLDNAKSMPVTYTSDIWAFGVSLFYFRYQRLPSFTETNHITIQQYVERTARLTDEEVDKDFSSSANEAYYSQKSPETLEQLIRQMLGVNTAKRITAEKADAAADWLVIHQIPWDA